jgi:tRNA A-37 threonylcarbamoyl transferase component Bud32
MGLVLTAYISSKFSDVLIKNALNTFEKVWAYEVDWFEEPNERRGGWSGVGRIEIKQINGESVFLFVKKQKHHGRRTIQHPISGEPTFRREFSRLQYLKEHAFLAPLVAFYAEGSVGGKQCAVLVTEALNGFFSLDQVIESQYSLMNKADKIKLIDRISIEVRRFHSMGLIHRSLYPKHIFVRMIDEKVDVALIDLEKARFNQVSLYRIFFDLAALNRHIQGVSRTERLRFFLRYMQIKRLGFFHKFFCRMIIKRSQR